MMLRLVLQKGRFLDRCVVYSREDTVGARPTLRLFALFCFVISIAATSDQAFSQNSSSETIQFLQAENADTISLEEKIAFMSPSGEEIILSVGTYRVEPVSPSALRLVPFGKQEVFVIKAQPTKHDEDIRFPVALMAIDDELQIHVVLLLPQQKGLEAIGSSSRGRYRGLPEFLTSAQIHEALMRKAVGKP